MANEMKYPEEGTAFALPPEQTVSLQKPAAALPPQQNAGAFARTPGAGAFEQNTPELGGDAEYGKRKRRNWRLMNAGLLAIQAAIVVVSMLMETLCREESSEMLALGWVLSLMLFPAVSVGMRPNDCYMEKAPFPKNRALLFILMLILGILTVLPGSAVETLLEMLIW